MNDPNNEKLTAYYRDAQSWSEDRAQSSAASRKVAWTVAGAAGLIAVLEAIALAMLLPLKTVVPYTLLVDKQTGFVQALKPLEGQTITPDEALVRSFLAQYVIARESFDIDSLQGSYRKVALWSGDEAKRRYVASMQASNPASPITSLPRRALVAAEVRSISAMDNETAMVRFVTTRTDPGGLAQAAQFWVAVIKYRFSGANMSAADRLTNPLGFQVVRYRIDAETLPEPNPAPSPMPGPSPVAVSQAIDQNMPRAETRRVRVQPVERPVP